MSEYQIVAFRAIDGPVSEKNLEYMRRQSSRAKVTAWSFDNEYHYGDFRGDAVEMLRRGYDLYFHYANFGIRQLLIRLPHGFPDAAAAEPYQGGEFLPFIKDTQGRGGTLSINPSHEPGDLDDLWDLEPLVDRLVPLRAEILEGDLRPLYLAHLAVGCDQEHDPEETTEAPVPAGLAKPTDAQRALAELYGLSDSLIAAAAAASPPLPAKTDSQTLHATWIERQPEAKKNAWLAELLLDPNAKVRAEILAEFRANCVAPLWPTVRKDRTIAHIKSAATDIARRATEKMNADAARKRSHKLAGMAANPDPYLRQTEELVQERTAASYRQIAEILSDLREALAEGAKGVAEQQAQKLKAANPTFRGLTAELRRKGFIPK